MIALDTNVLVGLIVSSSPRHQEAVDGLARINDSLCTTPTCIGEVLRVITHPKVFQKPLKVSQATRVLANLLESYRIRILDESVDWWKDLPEIETHIPDLQGNEVFDARIALCLRVHHVRRIFTWDSDFKKYPFLTTLSS